MNTPATTPLALSWYRRCGAGLQAVLRQRLLPNTLFSRLFALLVAAIVLSHVLSFVIFFTLMPFDHRPPPPEWQGKQNDAQWQEWQKKHPEDFKKFGPPGGPPPGPPGKHGHFHIPRELWVTFIVEVIGLGIAAWLGARMLSRPVQHLADAALRLSEHLDTPPISEDGPAEAQQAAQAFNRMQARLQMQMAERERFLAAVSHDLRTPLTRMQLRVEKLATDGPDKQRLHEDISEMSAMLNATLDYLRGQAQPEAMQRLDILALLEAMAEDAAEQGQKIDIRGQAAPLLVQPQAIRRCLSNLLANAIRYGETAEVDVRDYHDEWLEIQIRDHGPGIPEKKLEAVFQPFFRLESSRNRSTGGVGLGLSIARAIARSQGGDLTLHNAEGGGLLATLTLPRKHG